MLPIELRLALFVVLACGMTLRAESPKSGHGPLSVCELLENRLKYDGKMVEVRVVEAGEEEHCSKKIVTQGFTWPDAINLSLSVQPDDPHADEVDFSTDHEALGRVRREEQRLIRAHPGARVSVTYVGLFITRASDDHLVAVGQSGQVVPNGFGHLNACIGELVLKTARNPRVEPEQRGPR